MLLKLRNRHLLALDALLLGTLSVLALVMRYEGFDWPAGTNQTLFWSLLIGLPIKLFIFWAFGLYKGLWQYASLAELERIFVAGAVAAVVSFVRGAILFPALGLEPSGAPWAVIAFGALGTAAIPAIPRFAIRLASGRRRTGGSARTRAVVVGAGVAGQAVLRESESSAQSKVVVVAFVDDDPNKRGLTLGGVSVAGSIAELPVVVNQYRAEEVIIAIPGARGALVRRVVEAAKAANVIVRIIPTLRDILSGNVAVSKLRNVEIDDLLRRDPVRTDPEQVRALAQGKIVLVTGGGGSIGSEICRQIAELNPERLVIVDQSENSVFAVDAELRKIHRHLKLSSEICDIRNALHLRQVFDRHRPFAVFHAAAHKHVPLMEQNVYAAINNNVLGTRNVVDAALDTEVAHFVCISTDKAVRPTSVMGATKRLAEQIVYHAAVTEHRNFVNVRFGNVLGSSASVVPTFLDQIRNGGPVTVTHPDMRRYFMTIPEAVQLVLQAGAMGKGGELFVLDMGEPVRVTDLARDLIRLSGLDADEIEIVYTGVRPGEKLTEELFLAGEDVTGTAHPKILRARPDQFDETTMERLNALMQSGLGASDDKVLRELLHVLVPDYARHDARASKAPLRPSPYPQSPAPVPKRAQS